MKKYFIQRFPQRAVQPIWTAQFDVILATRPHSQHHHKTCLIKIVAGDVPGIVTMLHPPGAPQPPSSNRTILIVDVAGDISPEGGVTAQSGIPGGEYLDTVITLIR